MARSTQPDNAREPTAAIESIAADVETAAAAGNTTSPPRPKAHPKPSAEELERLRRKLIAKFH